MTGSCLRASGKAGLRDVSTSAWISCVQKAEGDLLVSPGGTLVLVPCMQPVQPAVEQMLQVLARVTTLTWGFYETAQVDGSMSAGRKRLFQVLF